MELPSFEQTLGHIREKEPFSDIFTKQTQISMPVTVRRGSELYDGVFAWTKGKSAATAPRPFAWALFSMTTGEPALISLCRAADFINTDDWPHDSSVSMKLPGGMVEKKRAPLERELMKTYEEIRCFVFEETLSREQVDTIVAYKDLFLQLCYRGHYPFYHALSPSFFQWLRLPVPEKGVSHIPKDTPEPAEYGYQLLILETLQQMAQQFREKIAGDEYRQNLLDSLHGELQTYKNGLPDMLTRPMELDIIRMYDNMAKAIDVFSNKPMNEDNYQRLFVLLDGVRTDLQDILYRQGTDPFTVPGDTVDVTRQHIVSTVGTDNATLDRKVAQRLAGGWEKNGKVVRPEWVSVYVHGKDR